MFFFAQRALQFWEMALFFFYFYVGKFGCNILPDLKIKQTFLKLKMNNFLIEDEQFFKLKMNNFFN